MKPMLQWNQVIAPQTTHKPIQICKNISNNSLKRQWIEANYIKDSTRAMVMSTRDRLSFQACVVAIAITPLSWRLSRNLKRWKWIINSKQKARKWMWIEDLVSSMDVSPVDDFFINFCILLGLGIVCGFFVIVNRFHSKNVTK